MKRNGGAMKTARRPSLTRTVCVAGASLVVTSGAALAWYLRLLAHSLLTRTLGEKRWLQVARRRILEHRPSQLNRQSRSAVFGTLPSYAADRPHPLGTSEALLEQY